MPSIERIPMPNPTSDHPLTRRTILAGGGVAVAAAVAACSTDSSSEHGAATPAPGSAAPSSKAAGEKLAAVADIPDGGSLAVSGVLLARTGDTVVGHSTVCTHMHCQVAAAGAEAHCPCHGSRYNSATGAVLQGPATLPLPEVTVTVKEGTVLQG